MKPLKKFFKFSMESSFFFGKTLNSLTAYGVAIFFKYLWGVVRI